MSYKISREHFIELAEKAFESIPHRFHKRFKNIAIVVKDYPGDEVEENIMGGKYDLLGLFVGQTYENQNSFFAIPSPYPDTIYLYQRNIESICKSESDIIKEIRATLLHEIGHYFGLSEEDLRRRNL
ncbi:MAG: metallopeptidase family protein [Thermodesulfovibrionales bacterium]